MSSYAQLGTSCYTNSNVLTSNHKFFPPDFPLYYKPYTYMYQYPGQTYDFVTALGKPHDPEDIKTYFGKDHNMNKPTPPDFMEGFQHRKTTSTGYKSGCCGKNI